MEQSEIIANQIEIILKSVSGIGKVYKQIPYVTSEAQLRELLQHERQISFIGFTEVTAETTEIKESFYEETGERQWIFVMIFAYNFQKQSDVVVRELIDKIRYKFNSNQTLNNTVDYHNKMDMTSNTVGKFTNLLCHMTSFQMTTSEEVELQQS